MGWPVSSAWTAAIRAGAVYRFECDLLDDGIVIVADIPVVDGGRIQVDETAAARRRCTIAIAPDDTISVPSSSADVLAPYGNELQLRAGVRFADDTEELVPIGRFRIFTSEVVDDNGPLSIAITGVDRAAVVEEERFEAPWAVAASTNIGTELLRIVQRTYPDVDYDISGAAGKSTPAEPIVLLEQAAPWSDGVARLARDHGLEALFDPEGRFVVRPEPDVSGDSEFDFAEGENCTVTSARNTLTAADVYNKVIVESIPANGAAPVRGTATDSDPTSPTFYGGTFGRRARWLRSPLLTTQAQVDAAAASVLAAELGGSEVLTFSAVPDYARDAGDVVSFTRERMGVNDALVIAALDLPLSVGQAMSVTTRRRRTA